MKCPKCGALMDRWDDADEAIFVCPWCEVLIKWVPANDEYEDDSDEWIDEEEADE